MSEFNDPTLAVRCEVVSGAKTLPTTLMASIAVRLPKWTKHVVTELGGRDPLGLSRVSFAITDYLLKGIITQTSRARYYSFYPWALWNVEAFEEPSVTRNSHRHSEGERRSLC
jgi:hypothetical protein